MSDSLIELCSKVNVHLEFGLQTADEKVGEFIDRKNNLEKVKLVMKKLNECKISYETSIIYGLPYQTFKSFENTIEFILKYGNNQIVTFPLGLLVGTKLYNLRKNLGFKTLRMSRFDTPIIVKNNWFSFKTWQKMDKIAKEIKNIQLCEKSLL
jgi:radical SAM superfamily enzyme